MPATAVFTYYRDGRIRQVTRDHSVAAAAGVSDEKSLPAFFRGVGDSCRWPG